MEKLRPNIRQLSPEEQAKLESIADVRERRQERIKLQREHLQQLTKGITETETVAAQAEVAFERLLMENPQATQEQLWAALEKVPGFLDLPPTARAGFEQVWNKIEEKREVTAGWENKSPAELFKEVFGFPLQGHAEVVQDPFIVHFRFYSDVDFQIAYSRALGREYGTVKKGLAGFAPRNFPLNGKPVNFISVERAESNRQNSELIEMEETKDEHVFWMNLRKGGEMEYWSGTPMQSSIEVKHGTQTVRLEFETKKDRYGRARIADVRCVDSESGKELSTVTTEDPELFNRRIIDVHTEGSATPLLIEVADSGIMVYDEKKLPLDVRWQKIVPVVQDKQEADMTYIHERQHQINALLMPVAEQLTDEKAVQISEWVNRRYEAIPENAPDAEEQLRDLVRQGVDAFMTSLRHSEMDQELRDEALAYFSMPGHGPESFLNIINDPEYAFRERIRPKENELIQDMVNYFSQMSGLRFEADPHQLHDLIVKQSDLVLTKKLEQDAKSWALAMEALLQKGYTKEQVIARLYQYPTTDWRAVSRRARAVTA